MVQIKIKQKLITVKNRQIQKYKWDRQLLNKKEKINKYQEELQSKLQEIEEEKDSNQEWQKLKQVILEAARELELSKDAKNANHWWDVECKRAIQEKNETRGKCLIRKTRTDLDIYQQKRTKANRICRKKKKGRIEVKIKEINERNRKRDTRKFYKYFINLYNVPAVMTLVCKDKARNILSEKNKYWKDGNNTLKNY